MKMGGMKRCWYKKPGIRWNFSREFDSGIVAICSFKKLHDFVFVYIPDRE